MRRLFKRTIVCLIAVMMIVSSLPFSAISVQAGTGNVTVGNYGVIYNGSGNRYDSSTKCLKLANDGRDSNFDIGFVNFKSDDLTVADNEAVSAEYSFRLNKNISGCAECLGLTVYYATANLTDFNRTSNGQFSMTNNSSSIYGGAVGADHIGKAQTFYGLNTLGSFTFDTSTDTTFTVDIGDAINYAKSNSLSYATVIFMLSAQGDYDTSNPDSGGTNGWSDTYVYVNEDSFTATTTEMSENETLKKYISQNINTTQSVPADTTVSAISNYSDYFKGIKATDNTFPDPGTTQIQYGNVWQRFKLFGIGNAVAVYTGPNCDIRFPVMFEANTGSTSKEVQIQWLSYSSSPFAVSSNNWVRSAGWSNFNDATSSGESVHNFYSTYGTTKSNNTAYFYTSDNKTFKNYIAYTGSGNTTQYYDVLSNASFSYCGYVKSNNTETRSAITQSASNQYVLNYYAIESLRTGTEFKNKFATVSSNDSIYYDSDLNTYYTAVKNMLDFTISDLTVSNVTTKAANIKSLIEAYNSAVSGLRYKYTYTYADNSTTVVPAYNDSEAYSKAPTNTNTTDKTYTGNSQHTWTEYTWPTTPTNYGFIEIATVYTKDCSIQTGGTCSVCGGQLLDLSAYNTAYNEAATTITTHITGTRIYTDDSISEYKAIVKNANDSISSVTKQAEVDNLTATIIAAKSVLRKNSCTVNFVLYSDDSTSADDTETYSKEYGSVFNLNLNEITKDTVKAIIVKTDDGKTQTKVYPSGSTFTLYVTKDVEVEVYVTSSPSETATEYSKVTFLGKNGNIVNVKYVEKDATISTNDIKAPEIPFYSFSGWDKASVTGTGSDIYVRASYSYKATDADKCNIHFVKNGEITWEKAYTYDSYVYLNGADKSKMYALASDKAGTKILTYLDGIEFYAPKTSDIYVVEVESKSAKIAITGNFKEELTESSVEKVAASFNCKFYLPEGCTPIEWGAYISSGSTTKTVKAESISGGNEYTIRMKVKKTLVTAGTVTSFTGKAYLIYKDSNGTTHTIVSDPVEQSLT